MQTRAMTNPTKNLPRKDKKKKGVNGGDWEVFMPKIKQPLQTAKKPGPNSWIKKVPKNFQYSKRKELEPSQNTLTEKGVHTHKVIR